MMIIDNRDLPRERFRIEGSGSTKEEDEDH